MHVTDYLRTDLHVERAVLEAIGAEVIEARGPEEATLHHPASRATELRVVRSADQPNSELMFDTWHFFRERPDLEPLQTICERWNRAVQFSDGAAQPNGSLENDSIHHPMPPGTGSFGLERVAAFWRRRAHGHGSVPEIVSDELAARQADDAMVVAVRSLDSFLAGVPA